jgi:hypothetical protein
VTDQDWDEWTDYHTTLFRWTGAEDVQMVNLWRSAFESRGYTADELRAASFQLSMSAAKTWRAEHLEYLLRTISGKRVTAAAARRDAENAHLQVPSCRECKGMGLVSVPHPRSMLVGETARPFYMASVTCRCELANRWKNGHRSFEDYSRAKNQRLPPPLMTIEEYEFKFPYWPEMLAQVERNRKAEQAAKERTQEHDRRHGALRIGRTIREAVKKAAKNEGK